MAFGQDVHVEQQFFGSAADIESSAVDGVLLAFLGAREIEIASQAIGNREVGLQYLAQHFLIKSFLESFGAV
jgi:hypothetical protein